MDAGAREVLVGVRDMAAASERAAALLGLARRAHRGDVHQRRRRARVVRGGAAASECEGLERQTRRVRHAAAPRWASTLMRSRPSTRSPRCCRFGPGEVVFSEGDAADGIYSVMSGIAERVHRHRRTTQQRIATLGAGATFGEMAVLDGRPRSTTVRRRLSSWNARSSRSRASTSLEARFPQMRAVLFANLARELAGRLRDANEEIRTLA